MAEHPANGCLGIEQSPLWLSMRNAIGGAG
jgi:hypothetical protein